MGESVFFQDLRHLSGDVDGWRVYESFLVPDMKFIPASAMKSLLLKTLVAWNIDSDATLRLKMPFLASPPYHAPRSNAISYITSFPRSSLNHSPHSNAF